MLKFPYKVRPNDPTKRGEIACIPARKLLFGDGIGSNTRYAVWPIHTRFDAVEWFVADAEHPNARPTAVVIRQARTFEEAVSGIAP